MIAEKSGERPLELNLREIMRHPLLFLRSIGSFLTAHHPFCSQFKQHSIELRGRKWCIGCTFNNISFYSTFSILMILWLTGVSLPSRFILFYGGLTGSLISTITGKFIVGETQKGRLIRKIILGCSFAMASFSILISGGSIFYMFEQKFFLFLLVYFPLVSFMSAKRMWETSRTCEQCEYSMQWSKCPGFSEIASNLDKNGFVKHPDAA